VLSKLRPWWNPATEFLFGWMGGWVHPNLLSFFNLVCGALAGYFLYLDNRIAGLLLILATGILDGADGAVARRYGTKSRFGAVLDSTFDRLSEGFILFGLSFQYPLAFLAMVMSFTVSYIKAKEPRVAHGVAERAERLIVLVLGILSNRISWALMLITAATAFTVITRLLSAYRILSKE